MKNLLQQQCLQSQTPGKATLLVIGGGTGAELPLWRAMQPKELVIYEPQKAAADELQRKLRPEAGETLIRSAIATNAGSATLQLLNNARESVVA